MRDIKSRFRYVFAKRLHPHRRQVVALREARTIVTAKHHGPASSAGVTLSFSGALETNRRLTTAAATYRPSQGAHHRWPILCKAEECNGARRSAFSANRQSWNRLTEVEGA